ncbi:MAG: M23 family metallopeptidase [Bacillota bacterium]
MEFKDKKLFIVSLIIIITLIIPFYTVNSISREDIIINNNEIKQGDLLIIKSTDTKNISQVTFNNKNYKFINHLDKRFVIIPISYWTEPGNYSLKIANGSPLEIDINIKSKNFKSSYLKVDENQKELVQPEKQETKDRKKQDQKLINKARNYNSPNFEFDDQFIWPLDGIITTEFGATRYVNNKLQSRHSGIDIAADTGTSIKAANSGTVRLAQNLLVTGNTIIIDHGHSIFSSYSHLSEINVKNDQKVKKGEVIGKVGSTGFSTGPHLHWAINVNGVFINPEVLIDSNILEF